MVGEIAVLSLGSIPIMILMSFFLMKSSKSMPKNWKEFCIEWQVQQSGVQGLIEDFILRARNVVEIQNLPDRVAVLTGGNRGIGLRILEKLLQCKMTVILGVRDLKGAEAAVNDFLKANNLQGNIFYEKLDIGNMSSVCEFAKVIQNKHKRIDVLINNAGIMAAPFKLTGDNFESHMAINYMGHFLLSHLLLPQLKASGTSSQHSRIVNVSSCVHSLGAIDYDDFHGKDFYYPIAAYNNSKLAQVLFTVHLNNLLKQNGANVEVFACHPGVVDTDLFENSTTSYIPWFKKLVFKTPEQGSRTIVHAAISPKMENNGGTYVNNCRITKMGQKAYDKNESEKLFDYTCEMLKIQEFGKI